MAPLAKLLSFALVGIAAAKTEWHQLEGYDFEAYVTEYGRTYSSPKVRPRSLSFCPAVSDGEKKRKVTEIKVWR